MLPLHEAAFARNTTGRRRKHNTQSQHRHEDVAWSLLEADLLILPRSLRVSLSLVFSRGRYTGLYVWPSPLAAIEGCFPPTVQLARRPKRHSVRGGISLLPMNWKNPTTTKTRSCRTKRTTNGSRPPALGGGRRRDPRDPWRLH